MLVWETDPSLRDNEDPGAFADVWCALPKVVFSRTLDSVQGNARLAEAPLAEEVAAALDATDKDVAIGGAGLAAAAIELGLVDELRIFRYPVVVGGGTPFLPPVTEDVPLDLIETRTFGSRVIFERYRLQRGDQRLRAPRRRRRRACTAAPCVPRRRALGDDRDRAARRHASRPGSCATGWTSSERPTHSSRSAPRGQRARAVAARPRAATRRTARRRASAARRSRSAGRRRRRRASRARDLVQRVLRAARQARASLDAAVHLDQLARARPAVQHVDVLRDDGVERAAPLELDQRAVRAVRLLVLERRGSGSP